ncbi:B-cell differentiation antigen CD72-like isoform X1 [Centrocercus urophasianus]|uniref:B-cell differentiation antigen CD72-like isoform X1 n=1 Tax=Centrocercus urophasianus TaxID=9002 RepID=UPI001C648C8F|nr:B-cell differentiation antigen CD72-like isoform X1 [Centrocercus urophasianus]
MAQSVLYADLRFAKGPGGHGTTSQALEAASMDDTDSPYENVVPGSAPVGTAGEGTQHSPGHWSRRCCVPAGLLAVSLLLLVALVTLGTCYWQVNHQLQNVSREQATERGHFSQEAQVWKQSLRQTQQELAWVQEELQQAWQAAHRSQQELARQDVELVRVSGALNATQKELQDVQGKLSAIKQAANSLHVCLNADCCPSGWLLYRGKCLFISAVKKSWWESHRDCVKKSSHLLIQDEWESWMLPQFLQTGGARYWIGGRYWPSDIQKLNKKPHNMGELTYCVATAHGMIDQKNCREDYAWICEQAPNMSGVSESIFSLLAKE